MVWYHVNLGKLMKTKDEIISWVRENAPLPVEITISENNISMSWEVSTPLLPERGVLKPFESVISDHEREITRFLERYDEYIKDG